LKREESFPNSFYEASITLMPRPDEDSTKKENYGANIPDEHGYKNSQQNTSKLNPTVH